MQHEFQDDIDVIAAIPAVPSILDVVCRMTGMRFAAVARVTDGRWIACASKDDIAFGLGPGGELEVETTICSEIRDHREPVLIEDVDADEIYRRHPTPVRYGFRSYASFPIVLPDGAFFGTLCAIDPQPRILKSEQVVGTFKLFAELIGHHLAANRKLVETQRLLDEGRDAERRQRVLQRELVHRMKNTLAMVQAVVTQSLRNATSLEAATVSVSNRIQALGRAQEMLTETNWETADIRAVIEAAIEPHVDGGSRFEITGAPADLTAQQGMGLALAIHELATNAAKYGSLSSADGRVLISWDVGDDGAISFRWREVDGPEVSEPMVRGFGSRLTERVVPAYFDGKARLDFQPDGVRYAMTGTLS